MLLNTRARRTEDCAWVTCSGEPLAGDVVYQTVGGTANTGFLKGSGIPTDNRGFIKVRGRWSMLLHLAKPCKRTNNFSSLHLVVGPGATCQSANRHSLADICSAYHQLQLCADLWDCAWA